jgi:hypothetical protein
MTTIRFEQYTDGEGKHALNRWYITALDDADHAEPVDLAAAVTEFTLTANYRGEVTATVHVIQPELVHAEVPEELVSWVGLEHVPDVVLRAELARRSGRIDPSDSSPAVGEANPEGDPR